MPFQNEFWDNDRLGVYVDIITGEPLFTSVDKYERFRSDAISANWARAASRSSVISSAAHRNRGGGAVFQPFVSQRKY
jgi:peptide methionine sulfoxide reductase MsrB